MKLSKKVRNKTQTIYGKIEAVNTNWYTRRNNSKVTALMLNGDWFVDWRNKLGSNVPKIGQRVRICYTDWIPDSLNIGQHHVIEDIEFLSEAREDEGFETIISEVIGEIEHVLGKLKKLKETA